mgnify:CR=1 FL=1
MKRNKLLLASLMMAIPTLSGCSFLSDDILNLIDPLKLFPRTEESFPEIIIGGELNKKSYSFTDEWDLSGLQIKTKDADGKITTLSAGQYEITPSPAKPRGFFGALSLKVKVTGYPTLKQNIEGVSVSQEQYDKASEINSYYSGLSTSPTLAQLQQHSFTKHTTWIKYKDVATYYRVSDTYRSVDEIPGKYKNEACYTGREIDFSTKVTKEHVWACGNTNSLYTHSGSGTHSVDDPEYAGPGSDLLQIRPCLGDVNTARGNCLFTEITSGVSITIKEQPNDLPFIVAGWRQLNSDGIPEYSAKAEPANQMKGDIARMLAYTYMHYSTSVGSYGGDKCGDLVLSKVLQNPNNKYGSLGKMLVAWNKLDPVSEVEEYRNHTVEQIQGNRNPFVDHPDWLNTLFNNWIK